MVNQVCRIFTIMVVISFVFPAIGLSDSDYKFKDENGKEVIFSESVPFFTQENPGPWKDLKDHYKIDVKVKTRKEGLETIKVLDIEIPHPMEGEGSELGMINKIYVLDKDGLIVAYDSRIGQMEKAQARLFINGIINYVKVYIETSRHGIWRTEAFV